MTKRELESLKAQHKDTLEEVKAYKDKVRDSAYKRSLRCVHICEIFKICEHMALFSRNRISFVLENTTVCIGPHFCGSAEQHCTFTCLLASHWVCSLAIVTHSSFSTMQVLQYLHCITCKEHIMLTVLGRRSKKQY